MARHPKFSVRKDTRGRWYLNIPIGLSTTKKKPQRFFYKSKELALDAAATRRAEYREHGSGAIAIKPSLAEAALKAEAMLAPFGIGLIDAVAAHVAALKAVSASITMEDAWKRYLEAKQGLREISIRGITGTRRRMAAIDHRIMAEVMAADIETELSGLAPSTANSHRVNIRGFWKWCSHPTRGWCNPATMAALEMATETRGGEIEVLSPAEVETLLRTAEKHFPDLVPVYVLAVFAGIRREEITRLRWQDIGEDGIEVSKATSKKNLRRVVPWSDTLKSWLVDRGDDDDLILPASYEDKEKACRRLAGWNVVSPYFKKSAAWKNKPLPPLPDDARPWPKNALRHTHASAAIANGASVDNLIFAFGHSGGAEMLRRHYVGRYVKKDAIRLFSIGPKGRKIRQIRQVV